MTITALGGFRVIDLTTHISGPFCTKLLADYGADVIKIEHPGRGDPSRTIGPFAHDDPHAEKSLLFFYLNCNKKGITLNIESVMGKKILLSLIKDADLLVESYSPGFLEHLGLGYSDLEKINPGLVFASISPFGQYGPHRDYVGNDLIYYAMSGMMYESGAYDREPLKHGHPQSYYMSGIIAAYTASAALYSKCITGYGQHIDLSLQESVASHNFNGPTRYTYTGTIERRAPKVENGSFKGTGFEGIVPSKDGYVSPTMQRGYSTSSFVDYVNALGYADIGEHKFTDDRLITKNVQEMSHIILPLIKQWNKQDYFNTLMSQGFVAGSVQTSEDISNCPQLKERGFFVEFDHPVIGPIKVPGPMFHLTEFTPNLGCPAPLLGQHNRNVYRDLLGIPDKRIVKLRQLGII